MKSSYNQKVMIYFSCTNMDHSNMRRKILCEATVLHRHNGRSPQPCRNVPSVDGVTTRVADASSLPPTGSRTWSLIGTTPIEACHSDYDDCLLHNSINQPNRKKTTVNTQSQRNHVDSSKENRVPTSCGKELLSRVSSS